MQTIRLTVNDELRRGRRKIFWGGSGVTEAMGCRRQDGATGDLGQPSTSRRRSRSASVATGVDLLFRFPVVIARVWPRKATLALYIRASRC